MNWKVKIKKFARRLLLRVYPELHHLENRVRELEKDSRLFLDCVDKVSPEALKERDRELAIERYYKIFGTHLDLSHPITFSEKMQWLKIHYRKQDLHELVDKYRVRGYLKKLGYEKYLNELYGVYANSEELCQEWDKLPDSFVLKVNHWSGDGKFFIRDKNSFDKKRLKELDELMKKNYYHQQRWGEWVYKDIEPCIIAEKYLTDKIYGEIFDYKMFCFNGKVKLIQIVIDRFKNYHTVFYDEHWQRQDFTQNTPLYEHTIPKPAVFDQMIEFAETVAKEHPFIRVDVYILNQKDIVFGELTFIEGAGYLKFSPPQWEKKIGDLLDLNAIKTKYLSSPNSCPE